MSRASAPISIARVASAMRSPRAGRRSRRRAPPPSPCRTAPWSAPRCGRCRAPPARRHGTSPCRRSMPPLRAAVSVSPVPRDFRVGIGHRGDRQRVEARLVSGAYLRRDLAFVGRLVGKHRLARDVADGEDVLDVGALPAVGGDEAALVDVHAPRSRRRCARRSGAARPRPARGRTSRRPRASPFPSALSKETRGRCPPAISR